MFFALTAQLPFADGETFEPQVHAAIVGPAEAPSVHEIVKLSAVSDRQVERIGGRTADVVARALKKDPSQRYQSAEAMLVDVNDACVRRGYSQCKRKDITESHF